MWMGEWREWTAGAFLLLLWLAACDRPAAPSPGTAASVDGAPVSYAEFEAYLERNLSGVNPTLPADVLSGLFDQFLDEQLLARLAVERELASPEAPVRRAVTALMRAEERSVEPTADQVAEYYAEHRSRFTRPERVRLAQILVEDRAAAEEAGRALAAGESFEAVARRLSEDPSAERGGDQGELGRGNLTSPFADIIFALSPGQTSDIVEADYGFHIFKVTERLPPQVLPLSSVDEEIRDTLRRAAVENRVERLLAEARSRYNPVVYEVNLPFEYTGRYHSLAPSRTHGSDDA